MKNLNNNYLSIINWYKSIGVDILAPDIKTVNYALSEFEIKNNEINENKKLNNLKDRKDLLNINQNEEIKNDKSDHIQIKQTEITEMNSKNYNTILDKNHSEDNIASRKLADKASSIEELKNAVFSFNGCNLKKTAKNTVFAQGVNNANLMFIGEAPGAKEDEQGIPFCGDSGKLLDVMLSAIGISREKNAYITNTVFWRPPANRRPVDEEIIACKPFVEKHIALINPKLLVLVGSTAATSLLGKHAQISKIRQTYFQYSNKYLQKEIPVTAIFHPAYLLRQPMQKKSTWYDLLKIKEYLTSDKAA